MDIDKLRKQAKKNREEAFQRSKDYCIEKIDNEIYKAVEKGFFSVEVGVFTLISSMSKNGNIYNGVISEVIEHYTKQGFDVKFSSTFGMTIDWSEQN